MATRPTTRPRKPPPAPPVNEPAEDLPEPDKRHRTPKLQKLESAVSGLYIMAGGGLSTLPDQVGGQRVKLIGISLAQSADEIAEAWLDLAEDDKRVLKALESLTSFSGWGKVIGVHLIAIGTSAPGIVGAMQQPPPPFGQQQQQGNGNGMNDAQMAMVMAEMFRQSQSQQRAQSEQFQQGAPPEFQQQPQQQAAPPRQQQRPAGTRPGRNAGIPSAADLGVDIPDTPESFPTAGPENVRG